MVAIGPLIQLAGVAGGAVLSKFAADRAEKDAKRAAELQAAGFRQAADVRAGAARQAGGIEAAGFSEAGGVLDLLRQRFGGLAGDIGDIGGAAAAGIGAGLPGTAANISDIFAQGQLGSLDTAISGGVDATNLLNAALGASGPEAQANFFNQFQDDPGFQALQQAGTEQIEGSRSAAGALRSGGTLKELFSFGQRLKSDFLRDRFNRLEASRTQGINATNLLNQILQGRAGTELNLGQLGLQAETGQANTLLATITRQLQGEGLLAGATGSFANTITGAAGAEARGLRDAAAAQAGGITGAAGAQAGGVVAGANQQTGFTNNLLKLIASQAPGIAKGFGGANTGDLFKKFSGGGASLGNESFAF